MPVFPPDSRFGPIKSPHHPAGETNTQVNSVRLGGRLQAVTFSVRILVATLTLAALFCSASASRGADDQKFVWDPEGIEDFSLVECHGQTVTKADLLGKPWVACFIFTRCAGANFCPRVSEQMKLLQKAFENVDVRLVTITVDPDRDTPEDLLRYSQQFEANPEKWWFLTGEKDAIYRLIRHSFRMIVAEDPKQTPGFEVNHSLEIMHVDEQGVVRGRYNAQDDVAMAKLRRKLRGKSDPADAALIAQGEANEKRQAALQRQAEKAAAAEAAEEAPPAPAEVPDWVLQIPALNASLNGLATMLLIAGYVLIKSGKPEAHKRVMLAAFGTSAVFLTFYLIAHFALFHYTGSGSRKFLAVGWIRPAYYTILSTHVVLAFAVAVLAPTLLYRALRGQIERHKRLARITYPIWLYVSITGVIIYFILYHWPVMIP
jgi:protein SCO1/2/putative membrane protein